MLIWSCSSRYKSSKGAYESYGKSRYYDTKRSYRRTNSSSSIKPSLWLIRSRFRTFLKAIARATSRRTKSRRLLKTTHCLTFLFPAKNETLDPILLGFISFQTVVNSSSKINKKLSTLIWCNFIVLKGFCCKYLQEQHENTFVESISFRAQIRPSGYKPAKIIYSCFEKGRLTTEKSLRDYVESYFG